MRSIPGMVVMSPADDVEAKAAVKAAYAYGGPRLPALPAAWPCPVFHDEENYRFEIGKGEVRGPGGGAAICATGLMVHEALMPPKPWRKPASTPGSSTSAPSSPWTRRWSSRPPGTAGRSSPWRSTTSSAVWARPSAPAWRSTARSL